MKKLLIAAILATATASSFALDLSGGVGATTNNIYRGRSLSDRNPSANVDAHVGLKAGPVDFFGNFNGSSVTNSIGEAVGRTELGVSKDLGGVHTELGLRRNSLFGGAGSSVNTTEMFIRGSTALGGGVAAAQYNKEIGGYQVPGLGRQSYTALGYTMPLNERTSVGVSAGWAGYSTGTKFNDLTLNVTHKLTDRVDLIGTHATMGKDATGHKVSSQTAIGVRYAF